MTSDSENKKSGIQEQSEGDLRWSEYTWVQWDVIITSNGSKSMSGNAREARKGMKPSSMYAARCRWHGSRWRKLENQGYQNRKMLSWWSRTEKWEKIVVQQHEVSHKSLQSDPAEPDNGTTIIKARDKTTE